MDKESKKGLAEMALALGAVLRQKARHELIQASRRGDVETARSVMALGFGRLGAFSPEESPLALAIESGNLALVELAASVDWTGDPGEGMMSTIFASASSADGRLGELEHAGLAAPFHGAILRGKLAAMDEPSRRWLGAAVEGDVEAARKAQRDGADKDAVDGRDFDALMLAAKHGQPRMARWLLDSGLGDPGRKTRRRARLNALALALEARGSRREASRDARLRACALALAPLSDCEGPRLGLGWTLLREAASAKWPDVVEAMMGRSDPNAKSGPLGKAIVAAAQDCQGHEAEAAQIIDLLWGVTDLTESEGRGRSALSALRESMMSAHVQRLIDRDEARKLADELSQAASPRAAARGPRRF